MSSVNENTCTEQSRSVPNGWVETNLGKAIDIKHGYAFKGEFISLEFNNKILITPGNFKVGGGFKGDKFKYYTGDFPEDYILRPNDVIVTMTDLSKEGDTLGFSAKIPNDTNEYLHNQRIGLVKFINSDFDKEFIYWFLRTNHYQKSMVNSSTGSTVRHTSPNRIREYTFYCPRIEEQKSIAAILTAFDDKIELLQAQNNSLEQTAQTIFKEWFGKYQVGDELPEGWSLGKLSEIAEFLNGLALQKYPPIAGEETLPVIKIRELKQGITSNTDKANTHLDEKYIIENGDVLFSWSGSLEVVIWQNGKGALNQHLFKVSSEKYPKWFYHFWILEHLREFRGVASDKATTMGHINRKHLDLAEVIIPDEVSLKKMNNLFSPIIEKTENNAQQIQTLKQTRDTLLPKLMSGKLRVNEFKD